MPCEDPGPVTLKPPAGRSTPFFWRANVNTIDQEAAAFEAMQHERDRQEAAAFEAMQHEHDRQEAAELDQPR